MKTVTKVWMVFTVTSVLTALTGAFATGNAYWMIGISFSVLFAVCAILNEN